MVTYFTPGPWFAEINGKHWAVRAFLDCHNPNKFKTFELCRILGNRADARLIAAAPEMKDLLWDAWQDLNALSNGDQSCDARYEATETMEKIMSLLRRIEGEEE